MGLRFLHLENLKPQRLCLKDLVLLLEVFLYPRFPYQELRLWYLFVLILPVFSFLLHWMQLPMLRSVCKVHPVSHIILLYRHFLWYCTLPSLFQALDHILHGWSRCLLLLFLQKHHFPFQRLHSLLFFTCFCCFLTLSNHNFFCLSNPSNAHFMRFSEFFY